MRVGGVFCALVAVLLVGGAARLVEIGGRQGAELRRRAERTQTARWVIPAQRGDILDTRGRVLAGTLLRPSAYVDPSPALLGDPRFAAYSVAPVLGFDPAELERLLRDKQQTTRFVWLKRRISDEEVAALERVIAARRLGAFGVRYEATRVYPQQQNGPLAPHLLGFVGGEMQGLAGIEAAYNGLLTGKPVERTATVDVRRRPVRVPRDLHDPASQGVTLVLTIDAFIQEISQDALRAAVEEHKAEWGTAVVMDPQTGEVLAMATVPGFDPADAIPADAATMSAEQKEQLQTRWRNRAVTDSYEPGSIFKPFVAAWALEEGLTRLDETFQINGPVRSFGGRLIHDTHAYGTLPLREIISKSSNIGMGLLGARCRCERLHRCVRAFGFGEITGVGLPAEHAGFVHPLRNWNAGYSPQSVPIGQEIAVTPIQMLTAFSVFANGGLLMQPRIVRGVIGPDGRTLADCSEPIVVRRVLGEQTVEEFRSQALVEVVENGTGKKAQISGYHVFGKTGTAQIAREDGRGYQPNQYIGSFVGGAPAEQPRVVALVSIYKPSGGFYYGGTVAAPAVKAILTETLAYMGIAPAQPAEREIARVWQRRRE